MTHADHVNLIKNGITKRGGIWADIGSGTGAFTLALRDIAGPDVIIFSVDKDTAALAKQKLAIEAQFPGTHIFYITADFTKNFFIDDDVNGMICANAIHFTKDTAATLQHLGSFLPSGGALIIVEYNTNTGNAWVPYPFDFATLQRLAPQAGFSAPQLLATVPSEFLNEMYATLLLKQ